MEIPKRGNITLYNSYIKVFKFILIQFRVSWAWIDFLISEFLLTKGLELLLNKLLNYWNYSILSRFIDLVIRIATFGSRELPIHCNCFNCNYNCPNCSTARVRTHYKEKSLLALASTLWRLHASALVRTTCLLVQSGRLDVRSLSSVASPTRTSSRSTHIYSTGVSLLFL